MIGAVWALATPPADLIVTGDGRHLAIRRPDGGMATLRDRAGDYVREMLSEVSGYGGTLAALSELPEARCSRDLCVFDLVRDGRSWRVLATRSSDFVPWTEMMAACRDADIVVADRRLPERCTPRWLRIDRALLRRTGGLAITLGDRPKVATVAARVGNHPWREAAPALRPRPIQSRFTNRAPAGPRPDDRRPDVQGGADQ